MQTPLIQVVCSGCFDVMHAGHFNLLLFCRQLAGEHGKVHVSLDTDEKIKQDKGEHRPIFSWHERFGNLQSLEFNGKRLVDYIYQHGNNDELNFRIASLVGARIRTYIVVGDSYRNKKVVGDDLAMVIYFYQNGMSSTKVIEEILRKHTDQ
jgi:cytidyltransferase-like protein